MSKLIKLNYNSDFFYDKAMKKSDDGDYIACLDLLRQAIVHSEYGSYSLEGYALYLEVAETYFMMGLYPEAIKLYLFLSCFNYALEDVFYGIIKSYVLMNCLEQAAYYMTLAFSMGIFDPDDGFLPIEPFELSARQSISLVKDDDGTNSLQIAKQLMSAHDTDFACQILKAIPKSSPQYLEAQNCLALVEISDDKVDYGLKRCEKILNNDPSNVAALSAKIIGNGIKGNEQEKQLTIKKLDDMDLKGWPDVAKVAMCMSQAGENQLTYKYIKRAVEFFPYERDIMLLYALACTNTGNLREAKDAFVKLSIIYPEDPVVLYYAREIDSEGEKNFELSPELPKLIQKKYKGMLENSLLKNETPSEFLEKISRDGQLYEAVLWGLDAENYMLTSRLAAIISSDSEGCQFLQRYLVDPDFDIISKKAIFIELLKSGCKELWLVQNYRLIRFSPKIPSIIKNKIMINAYFQVYGALAFIDSDFDRKLNSSFKKLAVTLANSDITHFNENAIAAVLAYKSNINKVFDQDVHCCEIFNCDIKDFDQYYKIACQKT